MHAHGEARRENGAVNIVSMEHTLQQVFIKGFDKFSRGQCLPSRYYKAANKFKKCRTAALGGHIQACAEGHINSVWYNSCKHRFCPHCNEIQKARWLEKQKACLLDTPNHHIIFTLPHELELFVASEYHATDEPSIPRCQRHAKKIISRRTRPTIP